MPRKPTTRGRRAESATLLGADRGARGLGGAWRDELRGALNATASILPFVLSYGFIAYGALGSGAVHSGLAAATIAVVLGGAVLASLGGSRLPAGCASASTCVVLGGALRELAADPLLAASTPDGLALVLATGAAVVVASGVCMGVLGLARAGSLVRFVPQPVLAGLMNGVAVLIVASQLPSMLGLPTEAISRGGLRALASWHGAEALTALATALLMIVAGRRWPRAPAPLLALIVAGVAIEALRPDGTGTGTGPVFARIGPLVAGWPVVDALPRLASASGAWSTLAPHLSALALAALAIALIGALETVLNLAGVQRELGERADPNRELVATGLAGVVSGAFGGLPVIYMRTRALATWRGGGRGRRSLWIGSALMALVPTVGLTPIGRLPTAAVAGVVIVLAVGLVDHWSRGLVARWWAGADDRVHLAPSLGIVLLVATAVIAWGVAAGLAIGIVVSAIVFMRTMHRQLVRARLSAAEAPSRRVHAEADEAVLAARRAGIRIVELEGALFFGNADRLADEADRAARESGATDVVIDLRRLTALDASGAAALVEVGQRLGAMNVRLRLAGVRPGDARDTLLRSHGAPLVDGRWPRDADAGDGAVRVHPDVDRAVEAAELHVLDRVAPGHARRRVALADCQLLEGLSFEQCRRLRPLFVERRLAAGERLFAEGDPGRAVYVITEGAIGMIDARRGQRFATLTPRMCFGETAVLDGAPRTADAVTEVESVVFEMSKEAVEALRTDAPEVAAVLYANLARHLSGRLRAASAGWRRAAE